MRVEPCSACDFPINILDPNDPMIGDPSVARHAATHLDAHRDRLAAFALFGLQPRGRDKRKAAEQRGLDLACPENDFDTRMSGAELWLDAIFERSVEDAADRGMHREHPDRATFISQLPLEERWIEEIAAPLREKYGRSHIEISNWTLLWSDSRCRHRGESASS